MVGIQESRQQRRSIRVVTATGAGAVLSAMAPPCIIAILLLTASCGDVNGALEHLSEARRLSADLHVQFMAAAGATDRAVMADTDDSSLAFAHEAEQATEAVQRDVAALGPILQGLGYSSETRLFHTFVGQFATYNELDRRILDLAVKNTNLKAQKLSFGPAQEAADAFSGALATVAPQTAAADRWHTSALAASAVAAVREIQVLQAPHIAAADDATMTTIEGRMTKAEAEAQNALEALALISTPASRRSLAAATGALDRLMTLNAQIIDLSRQNTNVRSLALSLDEKRKLTAPCEDSLRALENALTKRGYPAGR
jgi:hypothetical protein